MTGFNLPPGCRVSDIPGNRPEDMDAEAFAETISKRPELKKCDEEMVNDIAVVMDKMHAAAYSAGYQAGQAMEPYWREIQQNPQRQDDANFEVRRANRFMNWATKYLQQTFADGMNTGRCDEAMAWSDEQDDPLGDWHGKNE